MEQISVLHVDSETYWRGGQQQAAYLFEKMRLMGFKTAMACRPASPLEAFCMKKNLPFHTVSMHGEMDVAAGYRIASLCKKHGYNILHLHSAHALAIGLWAKMFYRKLRLIGVRRVYSPIRKNALSRFKYRTSMLDRIVCVSDAIRNALITDGVLEDKLVTIHSGVDLHKFQENPAAGDEGKDMDIPSDHVVVGTVAAFTREKDYPNLIEAAGRLVKKKANVFFCAVGDGPLEEAMRHQVHEMGLDDRFMFAGFQKDVGPFLKRFDIFVLPSYREGLGTSILDAQGVGLPVIACRTGGIPEIVQDGINGYLVPPHHPDALAEALSDLIENPARRKQFALKAKETVQHFTIDRTVEKNLELYRNLAEIPD